MFAIVAGLGIGVALDACSGRTQPRSAVERAGTESEVRSPLQGVPAWRIGEGMRRNRVIYEEAPKAAREGDVDGLEALLAELDPVAEDIRLCGHLNQRALREQAEHVAILGTELGPLGVQSWFQGQAAAGDGRATLLVFFEVWCPHSRREVRQLQARFESDRERGLNVVGLTRLTRNTRPEQLQAFLAEHGIDFPVALGTDELADRLRVKDPPTAVVVKEGVIVWRGHPARIDDARVEGWLE